MRRFLTVSAALFFCLALTASAQNHVLTITDWRMHTGDNAAWASPNFDDSQWAKISFSDLYSFNYAAGTHWYRATFHVPADFAGQELAVGMGPFEEVYDIYIDGVLVGR